MMNDKKQYYIVRADPEIAPEEIFQDRAFAAADDAKLESPVRTSQLLILAALFVAVGLFFVWHLAALQLFEGKEYRLLSSTLHRNRTEESFVRGLIKDRNNVILASNVPTIDVMIDPEIAILHREDVYERVLSVLGDTEELLTIFNETFNDDRVGILKRDIDREAALDLSSEWFSERGIIVRSGSRRHYQEGLAFSHLLGYTGFAQEQDLSNNPNLSVTDIVGRTGVEQSFDTLLRSITIPGEEAPGKSIQLTIDAKLQQFLYDALQGASSDGARPRGAAVALDPRDGSVRALVSLPSFDGDIFARGASLEEYAALLNDPAQPLFNRPIAGQYIPGSTIKPFVAVGALEEDIIEPSFTINVTGAITVPNVYNPDIIYTFRDWKAHGLTNLRKALAVSSNVYFYTIGGGYQEVEGLGIDRLAKWFNIFGFGAPTGIALDGEVAGLVPTPAWKYQTKKEPWTIGDTYHVAIGQGDVQVTPLQLARATAVIANGGMLVTPHLLQGTQNERGDLIETMTSLPGTLLPINSETLRVVQEGMRQAVLEGSAIRLRSLPVTSAGKTGTAQVGGSRNPHAWFTGYFPYEEPELVVTIIIENAGGSATAAMPVVEEALQRYFSQ